MGFPSRIADDPVLQLAMPGGDSYEYAEERRLFYVALTRARSTATLITLTHKESPFISELVKEQRLDAYSGLPDHLCRESLTSNPKSSGLDHVDY